MKTFKPKYRFAIRDIASTTINLAAIYSGLAYTHANKKQILDAYGICEQELDRQEYIHTITKAVQLSHDKQGPAMHNICKQLENMWLQYQDEFFNNISKGLDIQFVEKPDCYANCQLHLMPINEASIDDMTIWLDCSKDIDEIFVSFVIMAAKLLLLDRWRGRCDHVFPYDFEATNKTWLFAEIAIDAIFANTDLHKISENPSYKYLYSVKIDNINFMQKFRRLYQLVDIDDFFDNVYMFVHSNYESLSKFKNYLY